jgi:tetratricopeptide (TPR) repeat protein
VTTTFDPVIMCAMTEGLYERYKEALRSGHVAVLRGGLEEAIRMYVAAAEIAPSRALPHTSLGGVYMRLSRLDEALTEYAAAVALSPHDEGALLGQADALATVGRPRDAAIALDHVAEIQEASARLPEAADTLRRALELEEAPERVHRQRALLREIRMSAGDRAAEQLLARALRLRDEPDGERGKSRYARLVVAAAIPAAAESKPSPAKADLAIALEPVVEVAAEPELVPEPELTAEPAAESVASAPVLDLEEPPAIGVMAGVEEPASDSESEPGQLQPTGDELLAAAEAAEEAGDDSSLRSLLLWTARAYAREGRFEAGLDTAHRLLLRSPSDVDAHLVLVELYVARNWDALAAEKLLLLGRLADLDGDDATRRRLCQAASRAFPGNERLEALCS